MIYHYYTQVDKNSDDDDDYDNYSHYFSQEQLEKQLNNAGGG